MNTYKPNEFAEMIGVSVKTLQIFSCRIYGLRKYKKKIKGGKEFEKSIQSRNKTNTKANTEN